MISIRIALAASLALGLAACGDSQDASDDAMAESVELPADAAMDDVPMPAENGDALDDAKETVPPVEKVEQDAQQAADDAQAAVDDAIAAAEANTE